MAKRTTLYRTRSTGYREYELYNYKTGEVVEIGTESQIRKEYKRYNGETEEPYEPTAQGKTAFGKRRRVKIKIFVAWYDLWIGIFIDRKAKAIYVCLLPTIVIKIWMLPEESEGE